MYSKFELPKFFKGTCVRRDHEGGVLYNSYYQWVSIFLVKVYLFLINKTYTNKSLITKKSSISTGAFCLAVLYTPCNLVSVNNNDQDA